MVAGFARSATPHQAPNFQQALPFASTYADPAVMAMAPLPVVARLPGHGELWTAMRQARGRDREAAGRFRRMQFGIFRTL